MSDLSRVWWRSCVARGHEVRVYTGARHLARFADLGARVVPWTAARDFDEDDLAAAFPKAAGSRLRTMVALVRDGFIGTAPGQVRDLQAELAREPADVLLADSMSFGGMLTGELTGMPWALVNVLPVQPGGRRTADGLSGEAEVGPRGSRTGPAALVGLPARHHTVPAGLPAGPASGRAAGQHRTVRVRPDVAVAGAGHRMPRPRKARRTTCSNRSSTSVSCRPPARACRRCGPTADPAVGPGDAGNPRHRARRADPAGTEPGWPTSDVDVLATLGRRGLIDPGVPVPANARVVDVVDFGVGAPRHRGVRDQRRLGRRARGVGGRGPGDRRARDGCGQAGDRPPGRSLRRRHRPASSARIGSGGGRRRSDRAG